MSKLDEYVDTFELLGDWDQRYEYLVEMGEKLPPMDQSLKRKDNQVIGCMSQVFVVAELNGSRVHFIGDCDTAVIKGVLALLLSLCEGLTIEQIQRVDMDEIFTRLNLDDHLSPNRHLGVYAIFELMKIKALELAHSSAA